MSKKKQIILCILIGIVCLGLGLGIGNIVTKHFANKEEPKCENKKENNVDKVVEENDDSLENNSDSENYEEDYTKLFSESNISLQTTEDIENFINYFNSSAYTSIELVGGVYQGDNIDNIKRAYIISKILRDNGLEGYDSFLVKREVIDKAVSKVFSEPIDNEQTIFNFDFGGLFVKSYWDEEEVFVSYSSGGGTGAHDLYHTKIISSQEKNGYKIYNIQTIYEVAIYSESKQNFSSELKKSKDSKEILGKSNEFYGYSSSFDEIVKNINSSKLNSYKLTFDEQNRFVSCEKIN